MRVLLLLVGRVVLRALQLLLQRLHLRLERAILLAQPLHLGDQRALVGMLLHQHRLLLLQRLEEEIDLEYLLASPMSQQTFHLLTDEVLPKLL